jgi:peroxiredoxin/mono/diheme cytochrome c family protein
MSIERRFTPLTSEHSASNFIKRFTFVLAGLLLAAIGVFADDVQTGASLPMNRQVGQRLSNFTLNDAATGRPVSLYGFAGKKAVVLVFMGTDCPLARLYAPRLVELNHDYRARGVTFLGIYSNAHESDTDIAEQARKFSIDLPVLRDPQNVVADLALVERTPEVLVLDGKARICYRGAIDDQNGQGTIKDAPDHRYLKDALDAMLAGRPIAVAATNASGCLLDRVDPKPKEASSKPRIRPATPALIAAHEEKSEKNTTNLGDVDYASAAARIIQEKCQSCHRPGQVSPFSLASYDDARKHAAMIHEVVDNRRMPPWHADPRFGHFANDRSLSARERATLLAWVEQGTKLGDAAKLPPARTFPDGWTIGQPDLVVEIPDAYVVPAQGVVEYVRFRVPSKFNEDRWIQAGEAQPGDRSIVHHIIVYVDDHKGGKKRGQQFAHLCGYAPGDMPSVYPPGTAKKVPAGADFVFEIHYTPIGRIRTDRSRVGLIFAKAGVTRQAYTVGIAEDQFLIPANQDNVPVASSLTLGQETRLLSFMPHMHLRGKDFRYTISRPGQAAEVILSVPAYDFGWQSYYTLSDPILLPKGTRIDCLAHFDNSDKNPYNPDPSKIVRWGDQTFDEMMIGYIDIDLPVGEAFTREQQRRTGSSPSARAVFQAVGSLLGVQKNASPRSGANNPPR